MKAFWGKVFKDCGNAYAKYANMHKAHDNVSEAEASLYEACAGALSESAGCFKSFKAYKSAQEVFSNAYRTCENVSEIRDSVLCLFGPFLFKCGIAIFSVLMISFLLDLLIPTVA